MKFSERLADLMAENGLNKLSFAKKIGVSDRVVGSWVKEENAPKLESAIVVAEYFGVSLDYLSGRSDVREIGTKKDPALEISENGSEMLELYEQLPERKQLEMIGYIRHMVDESKDSGCCGGSQSLSSRPSTQDGRAV